MSYKEKILIRFAERLIKLRTEKGMSIRQLSAAADLEYSQVQRIEKGKVNFAFSTLIALAQGLDMEVEDLVKELKIPER
ncbi:MAG: helix-turn-helix domain-containing protein [Sediminibacterium sp.]|jgi:transcriptional regulator with XRE-family HTH domain|nr:helix-turn-helix transcriptional regulator [Chitinophagaceae bacterium]MCA6445816.1 helix-turn-helix transcriptional regulator [Chitinophagaceae bacterium]